MPVPILVLPGLFDSGPGHWQTILEENLPGAIRVDQRDWANPDREEWVANLGRAIRLCPEPPVLVAHSLGCVTAALWAGSEPEAAARVRGALLVAPSDVDRDDAPPEIRGFRPMPLEPLPFPSILVSSSTDPFLSVARASELAEAWGSRLVDVGAAGHVNAASGFGAWPAGEALVRELTEIGRRS